jgi:hypothetical protein
LGFFYISGFEQANKYTILDPQGNNVGFMAEEENTITRVLMRQWAKTHRSFIAHVFDVNGVEVLTVCTSCHFTPIVYTLA